MQTLIDTVLDHLRAWKLEYLLGAAYVAGYFHLLGKVLKALASYAG